MILRQAFTGKDRAPGVQPLYYFQRYSGRQPLALFEGRGAIYADELYQGAGVSRADGFERDQGQFLGVLWQR